MEPQQHGLGGGEALKRVKPEIIGSYGMGSLLFGWFLVKSMLSVLNGTAAGSQFFT
jgi:hypothetical protein